MLYTKTEDGKIKILPPKDADTEEYLRQVRRELDVAIAKGKSGAMHHIELENGQRGGWFTNSTMAVTELLTELVDATHSTSSKKVLTV